MVFPKKRSKENEGSEKKKLLTIMWIAIGFGIILGYFISVNYLPTVLTLEILLVMTVLIFRKYLQRKLFVFTLSLVSGILLTQTIVQYIFDK
jgi:hypothetical protein